MKVQIAVTKLGKFLVNSISQGKVSVRGEVLAVDASGLFRHGANRLFVAKSVTVEEVEMTEILAGELVRQGRLEATKESDRKEEIERLNREFVSTLSSALKARDAGESVSDVLLFGRG